jgi:hypothetical protein
VAGPAVSLKAIRVVTKQFIKTIHGSLFFGMAVQINLKRLNQFASVH